MSLATILALVEPKHGDATLRLAALAAEALAAPLDVMVIKPDPRDAVPAVGVAITADFVEQVMAQAEKAGAERAKVSRAIYDAAGLGDQARFIEAVGREEAVIAAEAKVRALTVLPCGGVGAGDTEAIGAALFETGRPVLVAPSFPVRSFRTRVAIFWKESPEAAKAVWSALPLLRQAEEVRVFTVGDDAASSASQQRLLGGLTRAGVSAEATLLEPGDEPDGDLLIGSAANMDADLVVMGAYSHSRLRELVFGGVTISILDGLPRPVFMAH